MIKLKAAETVAIGLAIVVSSPISAVRPATTGSAAEILVGLWRGDMNVPQISGELTIDGRKSNWEASIKSAVSNQPVAANVRRDQDKIGFKLADAEFRGRIEGNKIVGHWIQPPNEINRVVERVVIEDRHGFATPIELTAVNENLWRGGIDPMPAQLTFWMSIQRAPDESLSAVIRNPEFNLFRRNTYQVECTMRQRRSLTRKIPTTTSRLSSIEKIRCSLRNCQMSISRFNSSRLRRSAPPVSSREFRAIKNIFMQNQNLRMTAGR
jgi:hypothetical protein